jgi:tight adherence protein B
MNLILEIGMAGVLFTAAAFLVPALVARARKTADQAVEGFDRERVEVSRAAMLGLIAGVSLTAGLVVWAATDSFLMAGLGVAMGMAAPGWVLGLYQSWRRRRFQAQFRDALIMVSNALRAGFTISQALDILAREMPWPARDEFGRTARDRDLGLSVDEALERLADRMGGESLRIFVTAVQVGRQTGGDLAQLMDGMVKVIRDRERVVERIHTMTAETRFQGYTLAALPYLLLALWVLFDGAGARVVFSTVWGRCLLGIGTFFNVMALAVIRRMAAVHV